MHGEQTGLDDVEDRIADADDGVGAGAGEALAVLERDAHGFAGGGHDEILGGLAGPIEVLERVVAGEGVLEVHAAGGLDRGDLVELAVIEIEAAAAVADEHELALVQIVGPGGVLEQHAVVAAAAAVGGKWILAVGAFEPAAVARGGEDERLLDARRGGKGGAVGAIAGEADIVAEDAPGILGGDVVAGREVDGAAADGERLPGALEGDLVDAPAERLDERVILLDVVEGAVAAGFDPLVDGVDLAIADGAEVADVDGDRTGGLGAGERREHSQAERGQEQAADGAKPRPRVVGCTPPGETEIHAGRLAGRGGGAKPKRWHTPRAGARRHGERAAAIRSRADGCPRRGPGRRRRDGRER